MTTGNPPPPGDDLMAVAKAEAVRRKALYDEAFQMLKPIVDMVQMVIQHHVRFSLNLYPPSSGSEVLTAELWCRNFHNHKNDGSYHWYDIELSPKQGTCLITARLEELTEDEERDHYERTGYLPQPEWAETYALKGRPPLSDLYDLVREAAISALSEKFGGPTALKLE